MELGKVLIKKGHIDYLKFGHGRDILVVIPGLFSSAIDIEKQKYIIYKNYKQFKEKYTVYVFSKNRNVKEHYTINDMALDQIKVFAKLGLNNITLIGVSEGGMIAQVVASESELISSLIICVSTPSCDDKTIEILTSWKNYIISDNKSELIESVYVHATNNRYENIIKNTSALLAKALKLRNKKELLIHIDAIINYDNSVNVSKIKAKTLVIGGGDDNLISVDNSYLLNKNISGSSLIIYDHIGHDIYSISSRVNKDIVSFLNQ